eukprot:6796940-Prymnesium_polylepis.1
MMIELPSKIKLAVRTFVLQHRMEERCPQLAYMSDIRVFAPHDWQSFMRNEKMRIANVTSPPKAPKVYSDEMKARHVDEIVMHDAVVRNFQASGGAQEKIMWIRRVPNESGKGYVQDRATHGRNMFVFKATKDESADMRMLSRNVDAMLGSIHHGGLETMELALREKQPVAKATSAKAGSKRKADHLEEEVAGVDSDSDDEDVPFVYEENSVLVFGRAGSREVMAPAGWLLQLASQNANGDWTTTNLATGKSFYMTMIPPARKSTVTETGMMQLC